MNEIRFYDGENPDGTRPTIKEYTPTERPWPFVETEECFMDMQFGVLRWFDNADLMHWSGETGKPIMQTLISQKRSAEDYITDMNCTDKYELTDGEMSIKDAAEFVNNYLQTTDFSPYELSARKKAVAVNVVNIGGGKYGYNFIITPEYKKVLFDYPEMKNSSAVMTVQNDYDTRFYDILPGQIDMIETDKIYHFVMPAYNQSIEETETYNSIITLESAAKTVNKFFSGTMNFNVKRVEAVYLPYLNTAEPCWKFLMSFTIIGKKTVGVVICGGLIAVGSALCSIRAGLMWALPMANSVVWLHFTEFRREPVYPIWCSWVYFAVLIILLLIIGLAKLKKFDCCVNNSEGK